MSQPQAPTFFRRDDIFMLGADNPGQRFPKLPIGTYLVDAVPGVGFFLRIAPSFELPTRLYGDVTDKAERILSTFEDRPHKSTGVLLSGEKGSGKTLLAKKLSIEGLKRGYPTLIVNNSYTGDAFNTFLQSITQPCIILFDEFEKVYNKDDQQGLLTLFDGFFTTTKLLVLTTNNYVAINDHLQNRPGRLYYALEFSGLSRDFILEYGKENLKNKSNIGNLGVIASMVNPISFDILQAIVEECNRYDETPVKAMEMLNVKMQQQWSETYIAQLELLNGEEFIRLDHDKNEIRVNPFRTFGIRYVHRVKEEAKKSRKKGATLHSLLKEANNDNSQELYNRIFFEPENLVSFNGLKGVYEYRTPDYHLVLTRKTYESKNDFTKYQDLATDY